MILFFYRLLFPLCFIFFIPGMLIKLIRRPGYKKNFGERFALFSKERQKEIRQKWQNAIWIHAVSVGETNLALTTIKRWNERDPEKRYILSTTTSTGQEIARNKAPDNVYVIYCPLDFHYFVCKTMNLLNPSALVIFETELWPDMIAVARKRQMKLALINSRISDKSFAGYRKFRFFFGRVLSNFDVIAAQTELDKERLSVLAPSLAERILVSGNIKFDQNPPGGPSFDFSPYFGGKNRTIVLAASTHGPEEQLILNSWLQVKDDYPDARLVIVPRHAERGAEIEKQIRDAHLSCFRKSNQTGDPFPVDCLLADTTGELGRMIAGADLILMGKTFAGNREGQNIIEPAIMGKAIISGPELINFRQAMDALLRGNGVLSIKQDADLPGALNTLLKNPELRFQYGERARLVMLENQGALNRTIDALESQGF